MNAQLFLNNFDTQFIASVKAAPTTGTPATELDYGIVRVSQAAGAILGTLTNGDYYILTAFKRSGSNESSIEVMKVTNVDTSVINETRLTVLRGQEGTTPESYVSGDYLSLRFTASSATGMLQKSGNLSGLADNAAARANIGLGNVNNTSDANKPVSTAQQAALDAKAPTASPTLTGDLTLSSVGARIRGDFSNATVANRVAFQSSTVNGDTRLIAVPNGTATMSGLFAANSSDPSNTQWAAVACTATSAVIASTYIGSPGAALPLSIDIGGVSRAKFLPTGEVGIGVTPAVGKGTLQVPDINGAAASGFRNKIINGCCRISRRGSGAASVGWNYFGADGINTYIGEWSAVTGTIAVENAADFSRTSSGGAHFTNITAATGSVGYITHIVRIEAADALELAGKPFTVSARITSWTKQIDDVLINILKANTVNNFGASTLVANVAGQGPVSANTTKDVAFSTTLTTADCANGLQIEFMCYYGSAVTAAFHCFIADLQCCAGSQRMPFELRPIAIEEQLRRRYYRKQAVWVGTSTARTVMPIDMFGTPTITGGGTGYVSTGTDKDTLVCYQTTAGLQTLVLNSELV